MTKLVFLDNKTVCELLTMDVCIDAMRQAMIAASNGSAIFPKRSITLHHDQSGYFALMPGATVVPAVFGAKVLSIHDDNPRRGLPAIQGFVALFDHVTGSPVAIIDGASITAIRTAAASGLATALLARPDVRTHGIIGTGVQAGVHVDAVLSARPSVANTLIWGRDAGKGKSVAEAASARTGRAVHYEADIERVAQCDVVTTVTSSPEPVLRGAWLTPGSHINLVGSHQPSTREADTGTIRRSTVYVDLIESALNEAGDLLIPIGEGAFSADLIAGEIGALADGQLPGRVDDDEITLYKSLGIVAQDLFAAWTVLALARDTGKGTPVDL